MCSPCIEWRLVILIIVVAQLPVSVKKAILDLVGCGCWEVMKYLLDVFLKAPKDCMCAREHGLLQC